MLVDVGIPGRSGYDVARYVKRSPMLSHIPVVLLVGAYLMLLLAALLVVALVTFPYYVEFLF